jgi:hypothetical protein
VRSCRGRPRLRGTAPAIFLLLKGAAARVSASSHAALHLDTHHAGRLIVQQDRSHDRGYDRYDPRHRRNIDDDPRADARERYGNEEDQYSRQARRAYSEGDLSQRMHDDRPYNQPGYEPEVGRPGGRENVNLDRQRGRPEARGQFERRTQGGDEYGYDWERPTGGQYGQQRRMRQDDSRRSGQPGRGYDSGRPASPYDEGDVSSWYGGDTGMGDSGSSLDRPRVRDQYQGGQQRQSSSFEQGRQGGQPQRFGQSGQYGGQQASSRSAGDQHHDGPFTGRGPRGYQRSDERILEDVCELLTQHGGIDASSMEVQVQKGTVILRGMVDSGRVRRLTEEVVEDVSGVQDVENQLRVNQRTGYSSTSGDMGAGAQGGAGAQDHGGLRVSGVPAYGAGVAETSGVSTRSGPGEPGMSAGAGASQHGNRWQIRETMDVVGSDGESIGSVKSVRGTDFEVNRPMSRDLYVPFSAVRTVDSERVLLNCRASEVDQQQWPTTSPVGGTMGSGS